MFDDYMAGFRNALGGLSLLVLGAVAGAGCTETTHNHYQGGNGGEGEGEREGPSREECEIYTHCYMMKGSASPNHEETCEEYVEFCLTRSKEDFRRALDRFLECRDPNDEECVGIDPDVGDCLAEHGLF